MLSYVLGEYAMPSLENGITKEDLKIFTEEIIHQFHVSIEGVRDEGRRLAEDVARVNKRLDSIHEGLKRESRKQQEEGGANLYS